MDNFIILDDISPEYDYDQVDHLINLPEAKLVATTSIDSNIGIPLKFWYNQNAGLCLPSAHLSFDTYKIQVPINDEILKWTDNLGQHLIKSVELVDHNQQVPKNDEIIKSTDNVAQQLTKNAGHNSVSTGTLLGGGIMRLIAHGAQDVYLTGNPQIKYG